MVCMGNICRSPVAQGVLEALLAGSPLAGRVEVDSAGTHAYHVGSPPDPRARQVAADRGVQLGAQRARKLEAEDFERFDYLIAMDEDNFELLLELCPGEHLRPRLRLLMDFAKGSSNRSVPDPYYGSRLGFERVFDMVEEAAAGLLTYLEREHFLR